MDKDELYTHVKIFGFGKEIHDHRRPELHDWHFDVTNRGKGLWSIDIMGHQACYDNVAEDFVWQSLPSGRTDEFIQRTRFPLDIAIDIVERLAKEYEEQQEKEYQAWLVKNPMIN